MHISQPSPLQLGHTPEPSHISQPSPLHLGQTPAIPYPTFAAARPLVAMGISAGAYIMRPGVMVALS